MASDLDAATSPRKVSETDSEYAWWRLVAAMIMSTVGGVGLWSSVVLLTEAESHFGITRSEASLPYTSVMFGIMVGNVVMGRIADRFGIIVPVLIGAACLGVGYAAAAVVPDLWQFLFIQGFLIGGLGTASTFGPLIASTSLWFVRFRGIAVALVASGSYLAGTVWPPAIHYLVESIGWRDAHFVIGAVCVTVIVPLTLTLRRPPPTEAAAVAGAGGVNKAKLPPVSLKLLQVLLVLAGVACCVAMSMPQVHIVALCVDLNLGAALGAKMLSVMLFAGVVSRIGFGMLMDRIGAMWTLLLSSSLQALSLLIYLPADGQMSLYVASALFGLFQGGIVPTYAVIVREYFPASQAGTRVGLILSATIGGMALGGWLSGAIYDLTLSYTPAFLNGFAWNVFNIAIVVLLMWKGRMPSISIPRHRPIQTAAPLVGRWPGALQ
jgi:MFS family permease